MKTVYSYIINTLTMATFKITPTTTVAELKEQYRNEVGGTLRIYQGRSEADDGAALVSLGAKEGVLECRTSRTVGSFEKAFQDELNLKVKVYTKDNWVKVLDGITLETASKLPNGMTKAKMEEYVSNYSKPKRAVNEEKATEKKEKAVEVPEELKGIPLIDITFEELKWEIPYHYEICYDYRKKNPSEGPVILFSTDKNDDVESIIYFDEDGDVAENLVNCIDYIDENPDCEISLYASTNVQVNGVECNPKEMLDEIGRGLSQFTGNYEADFDWNLPTSALFRIKLGEKIEIFTIDANGYMGDSYGDDYNDIFNELVKIAQSTAQNQPISSYNPNEYRFSENRAVVEDEETVEIPEEYLNKQIIEISTKEIKIDDGYPKGLSEDPSVFVISHGYENDGEQNCVIVEGMSYDAFDEAKSFIKNNIASDEDIHTCINASTKVCTTGTPDVDELKDAIGYALNEYYDCGNKPPYIYEWPYWYSDDAIFVVNDEAFIADKDGGINLIDLSAEQLNTLRKLFIKSKLEHLYHGDDPCPVQFGGKYGYINENGDFVIEPKFDHAGEFEDGIARVYLNGKYFYINTKGEEVDHNDDEDSDE